MRARLAGYGVVVLGLAGINFLTTPDFAWFLFPAVGMGIPLLGRMGSLWADGIGLRQVLQGPDSMSGSPERAVAAPAPAARPTDPDPTIPLVRRVESFRRWTAAAVGVGGTAAATLAVGAPLDIQPLFPLFVGSAAAAPVVGLVAVNKGLALRRLGLRIMDVLRGTWRQTLATANPRLAAQALAEEVSALAPPEVLAGPYGKAVRLAADDRAAIQEVLHKLPAADRALIPDVAPTVNALVDRVRSLAGSLHRLEADVSPEQLARLDVRVAEAERELAATGAASDRERKLALLHRQQATLRELLQRRATLLGQLESAGLALQNLRLDLVKLRSSGIGSSLADLTHATQEARALSRDIGHVLDAAAEVRRI